MTEVLTAPEEVLTHTKTRSSGMFRNDAGVWYAGVKLYTNQFSGLSMVLGSGKWLYLVAVKTNGTLWAIHRDGWQNWHSKDLGRAFTGQPALVESDRTAGVVYDLVVPNATGQLIHYEIGDWFTAKEAARFGVAGRIYGEVGLVCNYANQLEVVARMADRPRKIRRSRRSFLRCERRARCSR
ncbi:MAG TPA: hypothetical protein VGQ76_02720 [Thermoanaerobaculia bacterium]|nr:hypothetical protein [Thermoanaerobaculia bacterium]